MMGLSSLTVQARDSKFTRRHVAPLYWMGYEQAYMDDKALQEDRYQKNVDWVATNFKSYGYDMVCTDGWVEDAGETVNADGYITKYNKDWQHDFSYWINYAAGKGLSCGIYYDPLWLSPTAYDRNCKIAGGGGKTVRDIRGYHDFNSRMYWIDTDKKGAEQYVKNYVHYFIHLGFKFLRIDFLENYERNYGGDRYEKALKWISEAAGDSIIVSLVMPNCNGHGTTEMKYGDMIRVSNDVFKGGWDFLSDRDRGLHKQNWPQYENLFDGMVGFSDLNIKGQMMLDADFIRLNTCKNDDERRFWLTLATITGSPLSIADQYDTGDAFKTFYRNKDLLRLHQEAFVAQPLSHDPLNTESWKWVGLTANGDGIVVFFNRNDSASSFKIDLEKAFSPSLTGGRMIDLWTKAVLGKAPLEYVTEVPAHGCRIIRICAQSNAGKHRRK